MYVRKLFLSMVSILYFHSETEITYHSVCRFQNLLSCIVFGKGTATLEEALRGDSSVLHVFFLTKKDDVLQKLDPLSFAFGLVTHLTHHVLKLTHGLALFERAAIVERRTFGTDAFLFLGKLGIWAATTEKCWAVLRYVIYGDVWLLKGLNKNGNLRLNEAIPYLWRPESKTFTIFRHTFSRSQLLDQYNCEVSEKRLTQSSYKIMLTKRPRTAFVARKREFWGCVHLLIYFLSPHHFFGISLLSHCIGKRVFFRISKFAQVYSFPQGCTDFALTYRSAFRYS